jgi:hypothetical protein
MFGGERQSKQNEQAKTHRSTVLEELRRVQQSWLKPLLA